MKQIFLITTIAGLMSCGSEPAEPIVLGKQFDFTQDTVVVDSLETVGELLDYLETIPSTHR